MKTLITRKQAFERGLKRFYTGKPCSKNHDAERFVTTGGCVKCNSDRSTFFRKSSNASTVSNLRGHFGYPLHPDDYAAALAYCQALDMQRGRTPHVPEAPREVEEITPERMKQMRELALGRVFDVLEPDRDDVDTSTAWLRDAGLLDSRVK